LAVTIKFSAIKRFQSRSAQWNFKDLVHTFNQQGWDYRVDPPATMIVRFQKTFDDDAKAVQGRKELEQAFRLISIRLSYRLEGVERT